MQGWLSRKDVRGSRNEQIFGTSLNYYNPTLATISGLYNGNISEIVWSQGTSNVNRYSFTYDGMSRLINTEQTTFQERPNQNVEQTIRYDHNSNIYSMTRINDGVNEYLTADYHGNQDINNTYDQQGNIIAINTKEMFMDYNLLNLPSQIKHYYEPEGLTTDYVYLTDGRKLTANFNGGEGLEYLGSFVYLRDKQGGLSFESTDFSAGRIETSATGYKINYHITDHLSSVRAIATSTGGGTAPTITSRMDYHPFGTPHMSSPLPAADQKHRYTFCGKEEQRIASTVHAQFKVAVMDQGARHYIPSTMQFTSHDPLAMKYPHISPYLYCFNNPVIYVDPDGRDTYYFDENGSMKLYQEDDGRTKFVMINDYKTSVSVNSKPKYEEIPIYGIDLVTGKKITDKGLFLTFTKADDAKAVFEFLAKNTKSEFSIAYMSRKIPRLNFNKIVVLTSNSINSDVSQSFIINNNIRDYNIFRLDHSYPFNSDPSQDDCLSKYCLIDDIINSGVKPYVIKFNIFIHRSGLCYYLNY